MVYSDIDLSAPAKRYFCRSPPLSMACAACPPILGIALSRTRKGTEFVLVDLDAQTRSVWNVDLEFFELERNGREILDEYAWTKVFGPPFKLWKSRKRRKVRCGSDAAFKQATTIEFNAVRGRYACGTVSSRRDRRF